jgi:GTPase
MNDFNPMIDKGGKGLASEERDRAILVSVVLPDTASWVAEDHLEELAALADTAGADVVERVKQSRPRPDSATFIGKGKVEEIAELCKSEEANLVIFDDDLSPVQVRNLVKKFEVNVVDRSGLILDIFAGRARTKEAKVQVELAQLEYYYPRLTQMWGHLKGQQGGIGFRGPGETQLEIDRRAVQRRITKLKNDLNTIAKQRDTRRKGRQDTPTVALVGYTNVGKSTLLNALSGSNDAFVENRLFATLDSKVRRIEVSRNHPILVIDTVGFIRKLPHHLVASFRSTLEEANASDVLIHVADLSHAHAEEQILQTEKVLKEMGLKDKTTLLVFNKSDLVSNPAMIEKAKDKYPEALFISAQKQLRVQELAERLEELLYVKDEVVDLRLQPAELKFLDRIDESIKIHSKEWDEGYIKLTLTGPSGPLDKALQMMGKPPLKKIKKGSQQA